jgi:hypothetical protein
MVWGRSPGGETAVGVFAGSAAGGSGQLVHVDAELECMRCDGEVGVTASLSVPPLLLLLCCELWKKGKDNEVLGTNYS